MAARVLRGSLQGLSAAVLTLSLGLVRAVLLARWLLPEHFALAALALLFIGLAARLRSLGIGVVVMSRSRAEAGFLDTAGTLWVALEGIGALLLLALLPPLLACYGSDFPGLGPVLAALVGAHLLGGLSSFQEALLRRELAFSKIARIDVTASVVMTLVGPTMAFHGFGVWALVWEAAAGLGTRFALSWGPFRRWRPRFARNSDALRELRRFGKPTWLYVNLSFALDRFDDLWIGSALGANPLGLYDRAYTYARYPRRIFGAPLIAVFAPVFAQLRGDRARLSRAFVRSSHVLLRAALLLSGLAFLTMPEFIHFVIGDKWMPMLWPFRLLLLYTALDPLRTLMGNLLMAVGRPGALRSAALLQTAFFLPAVIAAAALYDIEGVALAADAMLALGLWRLLAPLRECADFSARRLLAWPLFAFAAGVAAGLGLEGVLAMGAVAGIVSKSLAFGALFAGILAAAEGREVLDGGREILQILRRARRKEADDSG